MLYKKFLKFLVSGGVNTLVTYIIYLFLLDHLSYQISYVISFSLGVLLSYMLSKYFVFKKSGGNLGLFWLAGVYLGQLFLGMIIIEVWVRQIKGPVYLAPLISVTLTMPLIFFLSRTIFRK